MTERHIGVSLACTPRCGPTGNSKDIVGLNRFCRQGNLSRTRRAIRVPIGKNKPKMWPRINHGCDTDGGGKQTSSADENQNFTDQGNGHGQDEQDGQEPDRSCLSCQSCQERASVKVYLWLHLPLSPKRGENVAAGMRNEASTTGRLILFARVSFYRERVSVLRGKAKKFRSVLGDCEISHFRIGSFAIVEDSRQL